jgi:hypothetical protein
MSDLQMEEQLERLDGVDRTETTRIELASRSIPARDEPGVELLLWSTCTAAVGQQPARPAWGRRWPGACGPAAGELRGGAGACAGEEDAEGAGVAASGDTTETRERAHAGEKTEGESESCVGLLGRFGREWPSGGPWRSFVVDVCIFVFVFFLLSVGVR